MRRKVPDRQPPARPAGKSNDAEQAGKQLEELRQEVETTNRQIRNPSERRRIVPSNPC